MVFIFCGPGLNEGVDEPDYRKVDGDRCPVFRFFPRTHGVESFPSFPKCYLISLGLKGRTNLGPSSYLSLMHGWFDQSVCPIIGFCC